MAFLINRLWPVLTVGYIEILVKINSQLRSSHFRDVTWRISVVIDRCFGATYSSWLRSISRN